MSHGTPVGDTRVSCVIPAYNAERWLAEAVGSALGQTHPPAEVIVVDDGSTDGTAAEAARLAGPVRLVRQAHQGQSVARNAGVDVGTGTVLAFLDADDVWEADKLRRQLELLRTSGPDTVVFAHAQNFWADERQAEARRVGDAWVTRPFPALMASAMVVPRALFARVGAFRPDLRHGELTEWLDRARAAGVAVVTHPGTLVHRRIHAANNSRTPGAREEFMARLKGRLDARRGETSRARPPGDEPDPGRP